MPAMLFNIGLFVLYAAVSSLGLFVLKTANGILNLQFVAGLALYGIGFLIWYGMLTRLPLSVVFPIAAGILVVATQFVGYLFLDERIGASHLAGIGLVLAGIVVIFARA